jgi:hypothetical protein
MKVRRGLEDMIVVTNPLFKLGMVVATPGALEALAKSRTSPWALLSRHVSGDFGQELDSEDVQANFDAIRTGERVLSVYTVGGDRLYVITEADRSSSTILRVDEY